MKYHASNPTGFTLAEAEKLIGSKARLPLTGRIVEAGESPGGAFVKFEVAPRWGMPPGTRFVVDIEALDRICREAAAGGKP